MVEDGTMGGWEEEITSNRLEVFDAMFQMIMVEAARDDMDGRKTIKSSVRDK